RALALPALAQHELAQVYKNSDLGLFPNRCEGGTNLVLMEYLACGKPAVVSYSSGHRDVVSEDNALLLRRFKPMALGKEGRVRAVWDDPDLEEVVERLEWAYQHPGELAELGRRAGTSMEPFTWREVAARWAALLGPA
ncbi:MAG: glycosyltransferase family 4 protein, partial [Chloroflexi bacterium]|nr:glycosyltransferase family 4 protein [Chloroflexota bacterium]